MEVKLFVRSTLFSLILASAGTAADLPAGIDPVQAGQDLARELRSAVPDESAEFTGTLMIFKGEKINEVPIRCKIDTTNAGWTVTYETQAAGSQPSQRLSIKHLPSQTNVYLYAEGKDLNQLRELKREELTLPLAGSDFYLMDLGLEFFHWPKQQLVKLQMRKNRSCRVLESSTPNPLSGGYSRVLSWIDVESNGLIIAEAFNEKNQKQKEFEVGSVKKIRGKWQLQELKIRNPKANTRTELRFNLEPNKPS